MIQLAEDVFLGHDVFLLVLLQDVLLFQDLHCVDLLVLLAAHQQHLGVRAFPDHREPSVVIERVGFHYILYYIFFGSGFWYISLWQVFVDQYYEIVEYLMGGNVGERAGGRVS